VSDDKLAVLSADLRVLSKSTSEFGSKIKMSEDKLARLIIKLFEHTNRQMELIYRQLDGMEGGLSSPLRLPNDDLAPNG
jgi:hypothetical protein